LILIEKFANQLLSYAHCEENLLVMLYVCSGFYTDDACVFWATWLW